MERLHSLVDDVSCNDSTIEHNAEEEAASHRIHMGRVWIPMSIIDVSGNSLYRSIHIYLCWCYLFILLSLSGPPSLGPSLRTLSAISPCLTLSPGPPSLGTLLSGHARSLYLSLYVYNSPFLSLVTGLPLTGLTLSIALYISISVDAICLYSLSLGSSFARALSQDSLGHLSLSNSLS